MRIKYINKIPIFIGEYYNMGYITIDEINELNTLLMRPEYSIANGNKYVATINEAPYLLKFYIERSKIDKFGNCRYEDELEISKSLSNELYEFDTVYGPFKAALDYNDDYKCLILKTEDL